MFEWLGPNLEFSLEEFEGFFAYGDKVKSLAKRSIVVVIWLAMA